MKIEFTLDTRIPQRLSARYGDRRESVAIELVPEVMEQEGTLLYEEKILLAEKYLRNLLRI